MDLSNWYTIHHFHLPSKEGMEEEREGEGRKIKLALSGLQSQSEKDMTKTT